MIVFISIDFSAVCTDFVIYIDVLTIYPENFFGSDVSAICPDSDILHAPMNQRYAMIVLNDQFAIDMR